jgi:hypothetical protein
MSQKEVYKITFNVQMNLSHLLLVGRWEEKAGMRVGDWPSSEVLNTDTDLSCYTTGQVMYCTTLIRA